MIAATILGISAGTLALIALALGIVSQAFNVWNFIRRASEKRIRRLERALGIDVDEPAPHIIRVDDILEIHLKPPEHRSH